MLRGPDSLAALVCSSDGCPFDTSSPSRDLTEEIAMTTVGSGQTLVISGGQSSGGITVLTSGLLDIRSGGTASGTTLSGGTEYVSGLDSAALVLSGGTAICDVLSASAFRTVDSGGTALNTTLAGADEIVLGFVSGTTLRVAPPGTITYEAQQMVFSGGTPPS